MENIVLMHNKSIMDKISTQHTRSIIVTNKEASSDLPLRAHTEDF